MEELKKELKEMRKEMKEMKIDVKELTKEQKTEIKEMKKELMKEQKTEVKGLIKLMEEQKMEVKELMNEMKVMKSENTSLKNQVNDQKKKIEFLENGLPQVGTASYSQTLPGKRPSYEAATSSAAAAAALPSPSLPTSLIGVLSSSELKSKSDERLREKMTKALDQKEIKKRSEFHVRMTKPVVLVEGEKCFLNDYEKVRKACDYMDPKAGIFTVPFTARYGFTVNLLGDAMSVRQCAEFFVRKSTGKSKKFPRFRHNHNEDHVWFDCYEGEKLWVEVVLLKGTREVKVAFSGGLFDFEFRGD